jgi:LPXTG-motif cell wall-anchored protein
MWLAGQFGLPEFFIVNVGGEAFPIVWSIIGSALLSLVVGLVSRRRRVI